MTAGCRYRTRVCLAGVMRDLLHEALIGLPQEGRRGPHRGILIAVVAGSPAWECLEYHPLPSHLTCSTRTRESCLKWRRLPPDSDGRVAQRKSHLEVLGQEPPPTRCPGATVFRDLDVTPMMPFLPLHHWMTTLASCLRQRLHRRPGPANAARVTQSRWDPSPLIVMGFIQEDPEGHPQLFLKKTRASCRRLRQRLPRQEAGSTRSPPSLL